MKVLDLGPPRFLVLGRRGKRGLKGLVLACDIQSTETAFLPQVLFMQEDVFRRSAAFETRLAELGPFDLVISDMAPRTTGTRFYGSGPFLELTLEALACGLPASEAGRQFCGQDLHGTGYSGPARPHAQGVQLGQILQTQKAHAPKAKGNFYGPGFSRQHGGYRARRCRAGT